MPLSISAGAAVFPHDGNSYEVLMAKADRRMYRNKVMHKRDAQTRAAAAQQPAAPDNRAVS
jgi:GGDEF domain-containing protein